MCFFLAQNQTFIITYTKFKYLHVLKPHKYVKIRPPQTITDSSPWLEKLHNEVRHFEEHKIDVEKLLVQNREAERIRSQMVILERRVQVNKQ